MCISRLSLKDIAKSYGNVKAVRDFYLEPSGKSFIVLAGPFGHEKTISPQLVAGFLIPDLGEVYIDDQLINQKTLTQRNISVAF